MNDEAKPMWFVLGGIALMAVGGLLIWMAR